MSQFIRFPDSATGGVLVEVSAVEHARALPDEQEDGLVETGLSERVRDGVAATVTTLSESLARTITASGQAVVDGALAIAPVPEEVEVAFGVNATGEIGNIAVGKGSSQANFTVRVKWRLPPPG
jgi:Trypsin-co-occurring domain 1